MTEIEKYPTFRDPLVGSCWQAGPRYKLDFARQAARISFPGLLWVVERLTGEPQHDIAGLSGKHLKACLDAVERRVKVVRSIPVEIEPPPAWAPLADLSKREKCLSVWRALREWTTTDPRTESLASDLLVWLIRDEMKLPATPFALETIFRFVLHRPGWRVRGGEHVYGYIATSFKKLRVLGRMAVRAAEDRGMVAQQPRMIYLDDWARGAGGDDEEEPDDPLESCDELGIIPAQYTFDVIKDIKGALDQAGLDEPARRYLWARYNLLHGAARSLGLSDQETDAARHRWSRARPQVRELLATYQTQRDWHPYIRQHTRLPVMTETEYWLWDASRRDPREWKSYYEVRHGVLVRGCTFPTAAASPKEDAPYSPSWEGWRADLRANHERLRERNNRCNALGFCIEGWEKPHGPIAAEYHAGTPLKGEPEGNDWLVLKDKGEWKIPPHLFNRWIPLPLAEGNDPGRWVLRSLPTPKIKRPKPLWVNEVSAQRPVTIRIPVGWRGESRVGHSFQEFGPDYTPNPPGKDRPGEKRVYQKHARVQTAQTIGGLVSMP